MNSNDFDCPIRAMVTYIEGVNQAERQQLAQMLIYRAMNSNDFDCPIRAMVTYIEGVNQAERQQLAQMLVRAYVDGMNAVSNVQPPVSPPYTEQPAPPPYSPSV
ncbi:unnamed protein product [Clavelina lepadiformis]|uniref:Uncharacterized protein n=1 Tax=Clavelina lepadiformis TaxID=159417 RepID=A0ABP0G712_CLALP